MVKKKSMLYPVVFMVVLTALLIGFLAVLNQVTTPVIAFNQEVELKRKILSVFDLLEENMTDEKVNEVFNKEITEEKADGKTIYILSDKAYAVPFDGPGLWGNIDGYLGITKDLKTVTGIEFINQSETPGLGGRISESPYKEQYRGLDISHPQEGKIVINRPAPGGNIDAISGATQTSTFVTDMINEDIQKFIEERGAENE